jgi:minichromosome maintenance protein 10
MSAALSALHTNQIVKKTVTRSLSLTQKPVATGKGEDLSHPETPFDGVERDEDMQIVENLVIGPIEHKAPFDDPNFKNFEPYSRINLSYVPYPSNVCLCHLTTLPCLSSRLLPHDDLQEYMRGRYYLSPSLLYSVVRLSPNKQSYDVPIVGDWVTIAVIAERGQIQVSGGGGRNSTKKKEPSSGGHDDGTDDETPKTDETKKPEQRKKNSGKKYLSLRLVDFGHRSRRSSASSKEIIRGDALLNMLLFEADSFSTAGGDGRSERVYRGGSGGAFEACAKFREGTVIAIMNPKILKPFQVCFVSPLCSF